MNPKNPNLDALTKDPQAAQLLGNPSALKSLLSAPETQKLMNLLNQQAGNGLQRPHRPPHRASQTPSSVFSTRS